MADEKQRFLTEELLTMSINAALQRSRTYAEDVTDDKKKQFKKHLQDRLAEIAGQYSGIVSEDRHIMNIEELSNNLSNNFSDCLINGRFRIGPAQKALNLYLKYLWCLGRIGTRRTAHLTALSLAN